MAGQQISIRDFQPSKETAAAIRTIRKYFYLLIDHYSRLKPEFRIRQSAKDYSLFAINATRKVYSAFESTFKDTAYIGSVKLAKTRWAALGNKQKAQYKFPHFSSIVDHYEKKLFLLNNKTSIPIHFNDAGYISLNFIAKQNELSLDSALSLCFLLTYDLIYHCGPDNELFYDLFTNNLSDRSEDIELEQWARMRCQTFGRMGIVNIYNNKSDIIPSNIHRNKTYVDEDHGIDNYDEDYEGSEYLNWWHNNLQPRKQYVHDAKVIKISDENEGMFFVNFEIPEEQVV